MQTEVASQSWPRQKADAPAPARRKGDGARVGNQRAPDGFLDAYLQRIDPEIAGSFTAEQRRAIKTMLQFRGMNRHPIDIRRDIRFGRKRYYFVLLCGKERRFLSRQASKAALSSLFGYMALALGLLAALFLLAALIRG